MKGTKTRLTTAPEGFEYYRVCDQEGVCQVVRGMWAAQHLTEDIRAVSYTHLRAHETLRYLVCRLLLEKKKNN